MVVYLLAHICVTQPQWVKEELRNTYDIGVSILTDDEIYSIYRFLSVDVSRPYIEELTTNTYGRAFLHYQYM